MTVSQHPTEKYTFGLARAPVLAVFSTTVLAQLSSVFLVKESVERLIVVEDESHGHGHGHAHASTSTNHYFYSGALAGSISLLLAAYTLKNQAFQHVLMVSQSSSLQEHAADLSRAICYLVPGLSRILLPRINSMTLLAVSTSFCCFITNWFSDQYPWFDSAVALVFAITVFTTMTPLTTYTGRILLQTTPPHVHNQIDRCISEASTVDGVLELKNAHFWQLDFNSIAGTVDVRVRRDADDQMVLSLVTEKLCSVINVLTIQVVKDVTTVWNSAGYVTNSSLPHASYSYSNLPNSYAQQNLHNGHGHSHDDGGHGHSHDGGGGHGHSHSHGRNRSQENRDHGHGHSHDHTDGGHGHSHDHTDGGHGHSHDHPDRGGHGHSHGNEHQHENPWVIHH
uniref:Cation efflux protein transmembrane domain-containing protein n=1 Tax=Acrobeloides nanus TaxID=290746 RepID=A0A914CLS9_9BILA